MHQCERGMFDLRRGVAIVVRGGIDSETGMNGSTHAAPDQRIVLPVETAERSALDMLRRAADGPISLIMAPQRLRMLGAPESAACARLPLTDVQALDPQICRKIGYGPASGDEYDELALQKASGADRAAVALLKRAMLIPAAVTASISDARVRKLIDDRIALDVTVGEIERFVEAPADRVHFVSEADVPLAGASRTRFILFREPDGLREHVALQIGDPAKWPDAVPVRLHSACLTGDLFGSLRCDCGEQLQNGVARIAAAGGGVLLYLAQEGRGIGLANKLRAYGLQDAGADTIDADGTLGFSPDERQYRVAVDMLEHLGVKRISLLTNNPRKLAAIEAGGIEVADREAVYGRLNAHNERYLRAKADRSGHLLEEWLGAESEND